MNSSFLFIFRYMPKSGVADIATPVLVFSRNHHPVFHHGCTKSVGGSLSFIVCRLFDDGHSDWCDVINRSHFCVPSKRNGSLFSFYLLTRWLQSDWPGTEHSNGQALGHFQLSLKRGSGAFLQDTSFTPPNSILFTSVTLVHNCQIKHKDFHWSHLPITRLWYWFNNQNICLFNVSYSQIIPKIRVLLPNP